MNAGDDMVGLEQLEEDADDIALHKARRMMGSMSAMSGANGMVYMEYRYGFELFSHLCSSSAASFVTCVNGYFFLKKMEY